MKWINCVFYGILLTFFLNNKMQGINGKLPLQWYIFSTSGKSLSSFYTPSTFFYKNDNEIIESIEGALALFMGHMFLYDLPTVYPVRQVYFSKLEASPTMYYVYSFYLLSELLCRELAIKYLETDIHNYIDTYTKKIPFLYSPTKKCILKHLACNGIRNIISLALYHMCSRIAELPLPFLPIGFNITALIRDIKSSQ